MYNLRTGGSQFRCDWSVYQQVCGEQNGPQCRSLWNTRLGCCGVDAYVQIGRMWSTADWYQRRRSHSEVDRWVCDGRLHQMLMPTTITAWPWSIAASKSSTILMRAVSVEYILQWTEVRRRSDVGLESYKCKALQNLTESGHISDGSVVLVVVDVQPRLLQQWHHQFSAHWGRKLTRGEGDESQMTDDGWNLVLAHFIKGVGICPANEVLLGASWIRRETLPGVIQANSHRNDGNAGARHCTLYNWNTSRQHRQVGSNLGMYRLQFVNEEGTEAICQTGAVGWVTWYLVTTAGVKESIVKRLSWKKFHFVDKL